jgi:MFS transporter, ACS family, tartrate transporter
VATDPTSSSPSPAFIRAVHRKVFWRIVPLICLLYVICYLDRANVGYAKLQMQGRLGFSDDVFGWGFGIFFAGYLLLEIPGALIVEHWSARKWFARILLTWGACSMCMAFVRTPWQFYGARFMLGLAEAGFFPGVVVYLTHWFPRAERARALAGFVLAIPLGLAIGAPLSGILLKVSWFQLDGWQWVFLVEGLPAVIFGAAVPWLLTDRPHQARWLSAAERRWLEQTLETERHAAVAYGGGTLRQALSQPTVWLLAIAILVANTGGYALMFWLPTVVKGLLTATGREASSSAVLNWIGIVYLFNLAALWLSGQSSDRTGERKWHCIAALVLSGLCLATSVIPGQSWAWIFAWLCLTYFVNGFFPSPFWVLPTLTLSASAAAVSIGFINICANLAGLLGSPIVGQMKTAGLSDRICVLFLAGCFVLGGGVLSLLRVPRSPRTSR